MGEVAAGVGEDDSDAWGDGAEDGGGGHGRSTAARPVSWQELNIGWWSQQWGNFSIVRSPYHRKVRVYEIGVYRVRRVDGHNRLMLLQLLPERMEIGMSEVMVVVAVTGIQRYTIRFQCLQ